MFKRREGESGEDIPGPVHCSLLKPLSSQTCCLSLFYCISMETVRKQLSSLKQDLSHSLEVVLEKQPWECECDSHNTISGTAFFLFGSFLHFIERSFKGFVSWVISMRTRWKDAGSSSAVASDDPRSSCSYQDGGNDAQSLCVCSIIEVTTIFCPSAVMIVSSHSIL